MQQKLFPLQIIKKNGLYTMFAAALLSLKGRGL